MQLAQAAREIIFTDQDFIRIRELLRGWVGIALNDSKRQLVYNRLTKRIRQLGLHSFTHYLDRVEQDLGEQEQFINALTTNLTSFFREPHHFPILARHLQQTRKGQSIHIWCAASSTGEEPYSIAMTVVEALGERDARRVQILASDLDTQVLDKARSGIYRLDQVAKLNPERLRRFFLRGNGRHHGMVRIKPALQALISFQQINLLDAHWPVEGPLDAIFCRNVMIYFDKPTQLGIIERFMPLLKADGLMFAGHSESFSHAGHLIRLSDKNVYRQTSSKGGA
jgi:chemotaxis protein methyltransferase CheR